MGLGRLGARVARVGLAFDMNVIAWSPNLTEERAAEHGVTLATKSSLFASADIVTLHVVLERPQPRPDRRAGTAGDEADRVPGQHLPRGPGGTDALRRALSEERIAGAGLDVFDLEPLPSDHWLRTTPRTLLSPHMGYVTEDSYRVFYGDAVEDIVAFLNGTPIRTL